ncbi:3 -5 exonuclease [Pyrenophora seminiperda CCB06]|uniref:3-5 exonuclease n=1 Tax=Pyrenophora seminiperda CCB06 TaxID=1302712 RepID=A0A3M7M161_9PLEO|nr:3 -5 exonuclease [Pyrenophora seminiperda CCB06]
MEWPWNALEKKHHLQSKVGLIQIASEDKIALFHIGLHHGTTSEEIIAPTLKRIIEDPNIGKVGVNLLEADFVRLRFWFDLNPKGAIETSHLYRLVKYGSSRPELVSVKLVSMAQQVEDQFGLPLYKGAVRTSDWAHGLTRDQKDYAASDAYAGFMLYKIMNAKRLAMRPTPPMPIHADKYPPGKHGMDDPILLDVGDGTTISTAEFFGVNPVKSAPRNPFAEFPTDTTPLSPVAQLLFDDLVARRAILAEKLKGEPTRIASDAVLEALARERPENVSKLRAIPGMTRHDQILWGEEWLSIIASFNARNSFDRPKPLELFTYHLDRNSINPEGDSLGSTKGPLKGNGFKRSADLRKDSFSGVRKSSVSTKDSFSGFKKYHLARDSINPTGDSLDSTKDSFTVNGLKKSADLFKDSFTGFRRPSGSTNDSLYSTNGSSNGFKTSDDFTKDIPGPSIIRRIPTGPNVDGPPPQALHTNMSFEMSETNLGPQPNDSLPPTTTSTSTSAFPPPAPIAAPAKEPTPPTPPTTSGPPIRFFQAGDDVEKVVALPPTPTGPIIRLQAVNPDPRPNVVFNTRQNERIALIERSKLRAFAKLVESLMGRKKRRLQLQQQKQKQQHEREREQEGYNNNNRSSPLLPEQTIDLLLDVRPQTQAQLERIPGMANLVAACKMTGIDLLRNVKKFVPKLSEGRQGEEGM